MSENDQPQEDSEPEANQETPPSYPPPAFPDSPSDGVGGEETLAGTPPPVRPDLSRLGKNRPDVATHTVKMDSVRSARRNSSKAAPQKAKPVEKSASAKDGKKSVVKLRLAEDNAKQQEKKSRLRLVKPPPDHGASSSADPDRHPSAEFVSPATAEQAGSDDPRSLVKSGGPAIPKAAPAPDVPRAAPTPDVPRAAPAPDVPRAAPAPEAKMGPSVPIGSPMLFGPDMPWRTFHPDFVDAISGLTPGTQIGDYKIWAPISRSPFGAIFRGRHAETNDEYAIKFVDVPAVDGVQDRFEQVATQLVSLTDKVICPCSDFHYEPPFACLVNKLLTMPKGLAPNLHDYRNRFAADDGFISERQVLKVGYQLVMGISKAHAIGLLHGGLKPNNLLFEYVEGTDECWRLQLQVTDFGIASIFGHDCFQGWLQQVLEAEECHAPSTLEGVVFLAPEQWEEVSVSVASDIYAAAAVIHHFLTGHQGLERRLVPSAYRHGLHPGWDPILGKALRSDPNRRYESAAEFAECLDAIDLPPADAENITADDVPPEALT